MSIKGRAQFNTQGAVGGVSDKEGARLWADFLKEAGPRGQAAFDRLYGCFLPVVFRYCRSCLFDPAQAEDIANAVFLRLLERRPIVKSSFIGLLLRTARNLCATESASRSRLRPAGLEPDRSADPDPAGELERRDAHASLADCLDRLAEPDRTLVVLRYGEGLTLRQIREVLGLRAAFSTVTRRLTRIKAQLLRCLKEKNIF